MHGWGSFLFTSKCEALCFISPDHNGMFHDSNPIEFVYNSMHHLIEVFYIFLFHLKRIGQFCLLYKIMWEFKSYELYFLQTQDFVSLAKEIETPSLWTICHPSWMTQTKLTLIEPWNCNDSTVWLALLKINGTMTSGS